MKLLITGYARHGKDTVCEILRSRCDLKFMSSSFFVAERAVRPYLAERGITYATLDECYADRVNHRAHWFDAIVAYNTPDLGRLGRELFETNDIYCGLRNIDEFEVLQAEKAFDLAIWVDASQRLPPEDISSMTIEPDDCDLLLDNNGTLDDLLVNTLGLYESAPIFINHLKETA